MREATLEDITKFLECKRVAVVGVSRQPQHFSRTVWREFLSKGYEAIPVNREAGEIAGHQCFARVAEIAPAVEAALLMTGSAEATDQAMQECCEARVRNVWIYKSVNDGERHERAVEFCRLHGSRVVEGYCPMMFLPQAGMVHRFHRAILKISGSYPL